MEIQQLEPQLESMQEEYEKAQKFKEYVQGIFIENNSQEEFRRRVDAILNVSLKIASTLLLNSSCELFSMNMP